MKSECRYTVLSNIYCVPLAIKQEKQPKQYLKVILNFNQTSSKIKIIFLT